MEHLNLIRKTKKVVVDGVEKNYTNFFIVLENGSYVAIKPAFNKDYKLLFVLATESK